MIRHAAFQDLSRDHFSALLACMHIKRAAEGHEFAHPKSEVVGKFKALWRDELGHHFDEEDHNLDGLLAAKGAKELVSRLRNDHAEIRGLMQTPPDDGDIEGWAEIAEQLRPTLGENTPEKVCVNDPRPGICRTIHEAWEQLGISPAPEEEKQAGWEIFMALVEDEFDISECAKPIVEYASSVIPDGTCTKKDRVCYFPWVSIGGERYNSTFNSTFVPSIIETDRGDFLVWAIGAPILGPSTSGEITALSFQGRVLTLVVPGTNPSELSPRDWSAGVDVQALDLSVTVANFAEGPMMGAISAAALLVDETATGLIEFYGYGVGEEDPFFMGLLVASGVLDIQLGHATGTGTLNPPAPSTAFQVSFGFAEIGEVQAFSNGASTVSAGDLTLEFEWRTIAQRDALVRISEWEVIWGSMPVLAELTAELVFANNGISSLGISATGSSDSRSIRVTNSGEIYLELMFPPTSLEIVLQMNPSTEVLEQLPAGHSADLNGVEFTITGAQDPAGANVEFPFDFRVESGMNYVTLNDLPLFAEGFIFLGDLVKLDGEVGSQRDSVRVGRTVLAELFAEGTRRNPVGSTPETGIGSGTIQINRDFTIRVQDLLSIPDFSLFAYENGIIDLDLQANLLDEGRASYESDWKNITLTSLNDNVPIFLTVDRGVETDSDGFTHLMIDAVSAMHFNLAYKDKLKEVALLTNVLHVIADFSIIDGTNKYLAIDANFDTRFGGSIYALGDKVTGRGLEFLNFKIDLLDQAEGSYDIDLGWIFQSGGRIDLSFGILSGDISWNSGDVDDVANLYVFDKEFKDIELDHKTLDSWSKRLESPVTDHFAEILLTSYPETPT